jgi:hypothetical protein
MGSNIRQGDFAISEASEDKQEWRALATPATILLAFDTKSRSLRQIVGPLGFADGPSRWASLCATKLRSQIFTHRIASP